MTALQTLLEKVGTTDLDRAALVEDVQARLDAEVTTEANRVVAAYLLNKARNLTGSPHFEAAFAEFAATYEQIAGDR